MPAFPMMRERKRGPSPARDFPLHHSSENTSRFGGRSVLLWPRPPRRSLHSACRYPGQRPRWQPLLMDQIDDYCIFDGKGAGQLHYPLCRLDSLSQNLLCSRTGRHYGILPLMFFSDSRMIYTLPLDYFYRYNTVSVGFPGFQQPVSFSLQTPRNILFCFTLIQIESEGHRRCRPSLRPAWP